MASAVGFKRIGFAIGLVALVGLGALSATPLLLSPEKAREAVRAEIRAATGLEPVLRGGISVSTFPSGSVSFSDVVLGEDAAHPALVAEQLTARLRPLPLFAGRIEISDLTLVRPTIDMTVQRDGPSNWSPLVETLARTLKPGALRSERVVSFSEIRINDGTIVMRDAASGATETLTGVEMSLAWPSIAKSFGATGAFSWQGEPVDASITIADFPAALAGDSSGIKVRLNAAPMKVAFDGAMSALPSMKVEGTLAADSPSLRDALRWSGQKALPGGGLGRFSLKARAQLTNSAVALSPVNIELDGNAAEGVLSFLSDGRQTVQGTLAAEDLDVTPYLSTVKLLTGEARDWDRRPMALDWVSEAELDLRLSAARVTIGGAKLGRTAIATNMRNGKMVVTVGESQAFNGLIRGAFTIAKGSGAAEFKSDMQFADVDLETSLAELFGVRRLEGKGSLNFSVSGTGDSVAAMTRTLAGTATVSGRQGAITGLNVEQLLRRLERRPLSGSGDFRTGRTPYDRMNATIRIAQGIATVDDIRLDGPGVRLAVTGQTSIPARDLDLKGVAALVSASGDAASSFELPFMVQGPWDDPLMLPDPQSLIRRSGAAQPLLDAVRDRRTLEAVRSAIDRLTNMTPPPSSDAAAPAAPGQ